MNDEIRVTVMQYTDRPNLVLAYVDPISGKRKTKSAGTSNEKAAWKAAATWEEELRAGPHCPPSKVTWAAFRERYEAEHLASLAEKSREIAGLALNVLERHLDPDRLAKIDGSALSKLQAAMRKPRTVKRDGEEITLPPIKETSVATYLRAIKAALRWARRVGLLTKVPEIDMPRGAKGRKMKGGALVGEQFERLLAAVPKIRPKDAAEWQRYLTGLWLSGLRLGESVALSWNADATFAVDLSGRRPRFRIKGTAQKSGRDELLPMTPDFAEFLLRTPEAQRRGRVFKLNQGGGNLPLAAHHVGEIVTRIGEKSRVVVNPVDGKTASAHDLRRSFGTRWAKRVMPAVLQRLMRHASIQTTMTHYIDLDVDDMADDLWARHPAEGTAAGSGNISGNISAKSPVFPGDGADSNLIYEQVVVGTAGRGPRRSPPN
jgi:integrase